jgi:hypothetical protein
LHVERDPVIDGGDELTLDADLVVADGFDDGGRHGRHVAMDVVGREVDRGHAGPSLPVVAISRDEHPTCHRRGTGVVAAGDAKMTRQHRRGMDRMLAGTCRSITMGSTCRRQKRDAMTLSVRNKWSVTWFDCDESFT